MSALIAMPTITYICANGEVIAAHAELGTTLMRLALANGVPGIEGTCGGVLGCATCHVHVDDAWWDKLRPPKADELNMLEFANDPAPSSRLGCQIKVRDELDGMIVRVPAQ